MWAQTLVVQFVYPCCYLHLLFELFSPSLLLICSGIKKKKKKNPPPPSAVTLSLVSAPISSSSSSVILQLLRKYACQWVSQWPTSMTVPVLRVAQQVWSFLSQHDRCRLRKWRANYPTGLLWHLLLTEMWRNVTSSRNGKTNHHIYWWRALLYGFFVNFLLHFE